MNASSKAGLESAQQFGGNAAFVALALAGVTFSERHTEIPDIIKLWIEAEVVTSAVTAKELNAGAVEPQDEARRDAAEDALEAALTRLLVESGAVKNFEVSFRGDPRGDGPAIRVKWDGCPSNSFSGGLILPTH